MESIAL